MKRTLTILAAILLMAVGATAQKLSYSAVVRNSANELVANANITVAVSVTDGVNTYTESHAATTNANGLVTLTIGEGAGATGSLSGMNWPAASITATYTLPDGATVTNTVPVNAVPYALYAETAGSGGGGGIVTETDPTVPAWAKELTKPAYDYSEITGTPTIPTVNDGTLTIQKNGAEVGTFTANQSGNTTVNITITAQDIIDAVNGMTDAEKAALCSALNCGGGSEPSDPTAFTCGTSKMVDADGNEYETVQIGTQCWTKTNLRSTKAADGSAIPAGGSTISSTEPYYYDYSSHSLPLATRGYLYNWPAANQVCPSGWHLPSDAEWTTLTYYVSSQSEFQCDGNSSYIARALASTEGWKPSSSLCVVGNDPSTNNDLGFGAVPAGGWDDGFYYAGEDAYFWSSSEYGTDFAWSRSLYFDAADVTGGYGYRYDGFSVRCLRDETGGGTALTEPTVTTSDATDVTETSATLNGSVSNPDGVTITAQGFEWKATTGGTYAQVTATGSTMSYALTGLTAGTSYTYRAFVTTAEGTSYGETVSFTTIAAGGGAVEGDAIPCPSTPTVTDHEGNVYATVQIGSQCWMRDNLRTTTSPSTGTYLIPDANAGRTYTGKQARWYNNDSVTYAPMNYGLLYNWNAAVDTFNTAYGETSVNTSSSNAVSVTFSGHRRGICPAGWHLPSDAEWTQLTNYVGSQSEYTCSGNSNYIAKALASTEGWNSYSGECYPGDQSVTANNATGFSAVPAGYCLGSSFNKAGNNANFWSAAQDASYPDYAYDRSLNYDGANVNGYGYYKGNGRSVRCLRD